MKTNLVAPCGINCSLCLAFLREKDKCLGCRNIKKDNSKTRLNCVIRNCEYLKKSKDKFCSPKCKKYPCLRLKNLDKRYAGKYNTSVLLNLKKIREEGIRRFVKSEEKKWTCRKCRKTLCMHRKNCLFCNNPVSQK